MPDDPDMAGDGTSGPSVRQFWLTPRRLFALVVAMSLIGVWSYVMYLTFFEGRSDPRDRLTDEAYRERAESVCAPFRERIDALPLALEADSPVARADLLDRATDELVAMVAALAEVVPPAPEDEATAIDRWLVDWEEYIGNRRAYADRFRDGLDEPFRVTDRGGRQIDVLITEFAHVNHMESCTAPEDVG